MRLPSPAALLMLVALTSGCVAAPSEPYEQRRVSVDSPVRSEELAVRVEAVDRRVRQATVRIRARQCFGLSNGSGFAVAEDLIATNRHVVEGADVLQLSTWDGESYDVQVSGYAIVNDLALVQTKNARLPVHLQQGAALRPGDNVTAVGYPLGGELTFSGGRVVDKINGSPFGESTGVVRLTNVVLPGNSGGPLVDDAGKVVGVVFAIERVTGHGLAIPISALHRALQRQDFFANPSPC